MKRLLSTIALAALPAALACSQSGYMQNLPPSVASSSATPAAVASPAAPSPTPALPPKPIADDPLVTKYAFDPMIKPLLDLRQKTGHDNAMIYYAVAGKAMPRLNDHQAALMQQVLDQGWSLKSAPMIAVIASFQPALAEIRKGAALDCARNLGWDLGLASPVPDLLGAQVGAKMFCAEGRYLESQGKTAEALNDYLTVLTMGRDYSAPRPILIGQLISLGAESVALGQINRLVAFGNLDRPTLQGILARLKVIESTQGPMIEAFREEEKSFASTIKVIRERPDEARKHPGPEKGYTVDDVIKQIDRIETERKIMWGILFKQLETPYWQRNEDMFQQELKAALNACHPFLKAVPLPDLWSADVRALRTKARLLQTEIATALSLFKLENGRYPQQLSELVPTYFQTLPQDPFIGADFRYAAPPDGSYYALWGVGPDKTNNGAQVRYDPTNGTVSAGDIFY